METVWLEDFICLARVQNFTRAAEERNVTQPAFSRRIKSLENWLGVPLFERSSYPVKLSGAGVEFLPVAKDTIASLTNTRQTIRSEESGNVPFVRFAVLHTISMNYLAGRIDELERQFPQLRVRVYSHHLRTCCQLFAEGICDFLLYYSHATVAPEFNESQFSRQDIGSERLLPVAQTAKAQKLGWSLDDESKILPYLSYDPATFLGTVVDQTIGHHKEHLDITYMDALTETIKRRTLSGSGIAWLPESAVRQEIKQNELSIIGSEKWHAQLNLTLICRPSRLDELSAAIWDSFTDR